jgi:hypothetical protein
MNKVIFIADEYANNTALLQNLGEVHTLGGAEQDDLGMLTYLEEKVGHITRGKCADLVSINKDFTYLIANFATLSEKVKEDFIAAKNYVIYEHDHKYCSLRNPGLYQDCVVPEHLKTNIQFFKNAKAVFCMTKYHKEIMDKNIECNSIALNGSFWTADELNFISNNNAGDNKLDSWFIYGNDSYHKGLQQGIKYAQDNNLNYGVVVNQETRTEFLQQLSRYKGLIFMPLSPETCSRLTVEARMLNLLVKTNTLTGAAHEPWFKLAGDDLIEEFKKVLMPNSINIIKSYL